MNSKGSIRDMDSAQDRSFEELPFSPRIGCGLAILIALAGGLLVFQVARLMYFGEIRLGGSELAPNRVWLVRDEENAGLMVSTSMVHAGSLSGSDVCLETNILSLLWRRDQSTSISGYCLCYQRIDGAWIQTEACGGDASP